MNFDQTMKDNRLFLLFSLSLLMLSKSSRLLLEGGADPRAISHINQGIELISKQLDEAAIKLEVELNAQRDLDDICRKLGIRRADASSGPTNKEE